MLQPGTCSADAVAESRKAFWALTAISAVLLLWSTVGRFPLTTLCQVLITVHAMILMGSSRPWSGSARTTHHACYTI